MYNLKAKAGETVKFFAIVYQENIAAPVASGEFEAKDNSEAESEIKKLLKDKGIFVGVFEMDLMNHGESHTLTKFEFKMVRAGNGSSIRIEQDIFLQSSEEE